MEIALRTQGNEKSRFPFQRIWGALVLLPEKINAHNQQEWRPDSRLFDLILADGSVYPQKGALLLTDRQIDVTTGSIRMVCAFPDPRNILRPGQFGRVRVARDVQTGALLVPQRAVTGLQGSYQVAGKQRQQGEHAAGYRWGACGAHCGSSKVVLNQANL